jgi:hypothetical protein
MANSARQFERSITPENTQLTQSICRYCHRIVAASARRKLLQRIEQTHMCPEKQQAAPPSAERSQS